MTGMELVERLWESGTGTEHLLPARGLLERDPKADAAAVRQALRDAGVNPVTLDKADKLLAGTPLKPKPGPRAAVDVPPEEWPALARLARQTNEAASERQAKALADEEAKARRETDKALAS